MTKKNQQPGTAKNNSEQQDTAPEAKVEAPPERDKTLNVYQRVLKVMGDVDAVAKGGKAPDKAGGYKFVRHSDVTAAVRKALVEHGVVIIIDVDKELSISELHEVNNKTVHRAVVVVDFSFVNADDPDDRFTSKGWAGEGLDYQDKAFGKAYSYAIKYGELKNLHIETPDQDVEEDDIPQPPPRRRQQQRPPQSAPPKEPTPAQNDEAKAAKVKQDLRDLMTTVMKSTGVLAEEVRELTGGKGFLQLDCDGLRKTIKDVEEFAKERRDAMNQEILDAVKAVDLTTDEFDAQVQVLFGPRSASDLNIPELRQLLYEVKKFGQPEPGAEPE